MTFPNEKKTYLSKQDKSKKGAVDEKALPIINLINTHPSYYTTSSCSGRTYLWTGTGKKNETEWLKMSHELIGEEFFTVPSPGGVIWLRVEPFILHVACRNLNAANRLLEKARTIYKKSCILTASSKLLVEIRGSEFLEMPLYAAEGKALCTDLPLLAGLVNAKMKKIKEGRKKFLVALKELLLPA